MHSHLGCLSLMTLSVYLPHGGYDDEDYATTLEGVMIIIKEGRAMGVEDFFIGGDINIEPKLEASSEDFECLDKIGTASMDLNAVGVARARSPTMKHNVGCNNCNTLIVQGQVHGWMRVILESATPGVPGDPISERSKLIKL